MAGAVFILATDLRPGDAAWTLVGPQAVDLQTFAARTFGVEAQVEVACLPARSVDDHGDHRIGRVVDRCTDAQAQEFFVLPASLELNVWQRTMLGEELSEARRRHPSISIHHDTVDPSHQLLVECFTGQILLTLERLRIPPQQAGVLLVADGRGDPATRADSYRLMRLLWEQAGLGGGEVGFVRHTRPFLPTVMKQCSRDPLAWVLIPQSQWDGELHDFAGVMLGDHQRAHPEAAGWRLVDPPRDHPAIRAWLEQRLSRLWHEKRARQATRIPSARYQPSANPAGVWSGENWVAPTEATIAPRAGLIGRARESTHLAEALERVLPRADRYLVKVTWHGYAQGTYTSPAALDLLLGALPGRAVVVEGHTSSRNLGGLDIEWEEESARHRTWIRQQDLEFLRRTGLADVIAKHKAQYVNVTEEWWDGNCSPIETVRAALGNTSLQNPELAGFVPAVLMELRGAPLISFARFKGPTRLGVSNLFGLIPHPLRTAWHGAAITDFAAVCCDLARLYGGLFPTFGLVEAFESAVRWDRKGLYRSRWGNYDLVLTDGLFTLSEGLVGADILASQLQGQDVNRSAFFAVVRERLGSEGLDLDVPLPHDLRAILA
jgi:hypothetical protein